MLFLNQIFSAQKASSRFLSYGRAIIRVLWHLRSKRGDFFTKLTGEITHVKLLNLETQGSYAQFETFVEV